MNEDRDHLNQLLTQAEELMRSAAAARAGIRRVAGAGEAADGLVRAVADGEGRVQELFVDPRGMRLSAEALAKELGAAVLAAQEDAERQVHELMATLDTPTPPEPLGADFVQERIDQVSRDLGTE